MGSNVGTTPTLAELSETRLAFEDERDPLERIRLGERLDEIRNRIAASPTGGISGLSDDQVLSRVEHRKRQLDRLSERRLDPSFSAHAMGAGGGFDPVELIEHNTAIDASAGRSQLEDDLSALLAEADRREL